MLLDELDASGCSLSNVRQSEVCNFIFLYKVTFLFSSQSVAHIEKSQNLLTNEHKPKKKKIAEMEGESSRCRYLKTI